MAELNTYRRSVVIAKPQWWTTLLDSDFTGEGPLELI